MPPQDYSSSGGEKGVGPGCLLGAFFKKNLGGYLVGLAKRAICISGSSIIGKSAQHDPNLSPKMSPN